MVGEPWDFKSSEGDNFFTLQIVRKIESRNELYVAKVLYPFIQKGYEIKYVLLSQRHIKPNGNYNIYSINSDELYKEEQIEKKELLFVAIGSIKDNL